MENERQFKGVWIDKEIWLDKRLNAIEKVILTEIDSLDNEESGCYASNKYLAEFCQCSETKISTAISKLIDLEYIYVKSFDGRTRILKSRVSNFERQDLKNLKSDIKKVKDNNIYNNINNKESKKESNYDKIINSQITNEELKNTLYEFIKMRKFIKKPLTDRALQLLINKLHKLANTPEKAIKILEQSIVHSWQDIYELKENCFKNNSSKQAKKTEYTKEQLDNLFDNIDDVEI